MTILHYVGRLYSLDTLDTRFTTSSKTPLSNARPTTGQGSANKIEKEVSEAPRQRWTTLEFYIYYLVILVAIPSMFKATYDVSNRKPVWWALGDQNVDGRNSLSFKLLQVRAPSLPRLDRRSKGR